MDIARYINIRNVPIIKSILFSCAVKSRLENRNLSKPVNELTWFFTLALYQKYTTISTAVIFTKAILPPSYKYK